MNRKITGHEFGGAGELLSIVTGDKPGAGGANHSYRIVDVDDDEKCLGEIDFQNGPVPENGVNGVTEGALLAVVADRLRSFQGGQFSCRENAIALTKIEEALHWMHARTQNRVRRDVEGKLEP